MIIGFSGTRHGMTDKQKEEVMKELRIVNSLTKKIEYHHGDCIGADEEFHIIVDDFENTIIHPPKRTTHRAYCKAKTILAPKDYLPRNDDIVLACNVLIATPHSMENTRGGTWYTIGKAYREKKEVIIITPDGRCLTDEYEDYDNNRHRYARV